MASDILAAANLTPEQAKSAADAALDVKKNQHDALIRSGGVTEYTKATHNSLLFQPDCRWDDMLSSAPLSISVMGSIYIASTAPKTGTVTIFPPKDGFKFITTFRGDNGEMSLQSALVQINGQGERAFELAVKNMSSIAAFSDNVINNIKNIQQLLGDPDSARVMMKPTFQSLRRSVQTCAKLAKEVATDYHTWLGAICEVHAACCQTSTDVAVKQRANKVHFAAMQAQVKDGQKAVDAAKESLDVLKTSLQHANEQYKKVADEFPSGWDLVGMEVVSNLASVATSALNQAIPVLVKKLSNTEQAKDAFSIFKDDHGGVKDSDKVDHSNVPDATSKDTPPPNGNVLPENYDDIAYSIIRSAYGHIETVANLLNSSGGNIDWDSINSTDDQKTQSGIGVIKVLLEGDLKVLGNKSDAKKPTVDLESIINKCLEVVKGVDQYTGKNFSRPKPTPDSAEVKKWKEDMHSAFVEATAMWQTSQTIPGAKTPATPPPSGGDSKTPDGAGLRAQIIGAATTRLSSASSVLQNAQNNYKESSKEYVEATQDFSAIQVELSKLDGEKVSLDQVGALLLKSIELLIQLQNQINKLVAFFDAFDAIVNVAVEAQANPYLDSLEEAVEKPGVLGGYTRLEICSILLFNSMLNIRCYFALFVKLAKLYMEIDLKFLKPGREILSELQIEVTGDMSEQRMKQKQLQLNQYTSKILPEVKEAISERQKEVIDSMETEAAETARQMQTLPPSPPLTQKQITDASKKSADIAKEGIKASNSFARAPFKLPVV